MLNQTKPYAFTRYSGKTAIVLHGTLPGPATAVFHSMDFKLADITKASEFKELFDYYKINKVVVELNWSLLSTTVSTTPVNAGLDNIIKPLVYYFRDYDDSAAPTTEDEFMERQAVRSFRLTPNRKFTIALRPRVSEAVYRTTLTTGYKRATKAVQLDCNQDDVPHYGLKLMVQKAAEQMGEISIRVKYYCTFYGVK